MSRIVVVATGIEVDIDKLKGFAYRAKLITYASGCGLVPESRIWVPGNTEYEYHEDGLYYRDSFCGSFAVPGREWIKLDNEYGRSVWSMYYDGGMQPPYNVPSAENIAFANRHFRILKSALSNLEPENPYRGPTKQLFHHEDCRDIWYGCTVKGSFERFNGNEWMRFLPEGRSIAKVTFAQRFGGGIIIYK
ncbi:MAG: DUF5680 domain-containing protein [Patescibacteria group bacterium]|jgi:hypothetical protein